MPKEGMYDQHKTELTRAAMIGLKAEATAQGRSMKEVASDLIMAGLSPAAQQFVQTLTGKAEEIPAQATVVYANPEGELHSHPPGINAEVRSEGEGQESIPHDLPGTDSTLHAPVGLSPGAKAMERLVPLTGQVGGPSQPTGLERWREKKAEEWRKEKAKYGTVGVHTAKPLSHNQPQIEDVPGLPERIMDLKSGGKSYREIGNLVGYSKSAIGKFFERMNKKEG